MLEHLLNAVGKTGVGKTVLVLGYGAEQVRKRFPQCAAVIQTEQLGSGHAIQCARSAFKNFDGDILLLYSDTPMLTDETLKKLVALHRRKGYDSTILTVCLNDAGEYGRIVRNAAGNVIKIVEAKDTDDDTRAINEINVGAYVFKARELFENLDKIRMNSKKKEYYLTDIIDILNERGFTVGAMRTGDVDECLGVNSRVELAMANRVIRERVNRKFMNDGITIVDPETTYIDAGVRIGEETVVYPNTFIETGVVIGQRCKIGPFARIKAGSKIGKNVEIGNFVEIVRSVIGDNCKVKHHAYLGDARLGHDINVGAGAITANYDGKTKNRTIIGNGAFIGVGSTLIAPVTIGRSAVVGAGSVVTKGHNVPADSVVCGVPARMLRRKKFSN